MSERAFQTQVEQMCSWMGLTYYHTHNSQHSSPGFPDLVIVGANGVIFRELKSETGKPTPMQTFWLAILSAAGQDAKLWRPSDLPDIQKELQALGRVQVVKPLKQLRKAVRHGR